jgi:hypothetical protein
MIRIIVRSDNAGMAANVGGSVLTTFTSFDVDLPELEDALNIAKTNSYAHAQVVGVEVLPTRTPQADKEEKD